MALGEFAVLSSTYLIIGSFFIQFIGFFCPNWACDYPPDAANSTNMTNTSCQMRSLFYSCPEYGPCDDKILDHRVFGLTLTNFLLNIPCFIATVKQYRKNKKLDFSDGTRKVATIVYFIGEVLTAVAALLLYINFSEIGWSAYLFRSVGAVIGLIIATVVALTIICYCLYESSKEGKKAADDVEVYVVNNTRNTVTVFK